MAELVFDDLNALQVKKIWKAAVKAVSPDSFQVECSMNVKVKTVYTEEGVTREVDESEQAKERAQEEIERLAHKHVARVKWLGSGNYLVYGGASAVNLMWLAEVVGNPLSWPLSSPTIKLLKGKEEKLVCDTGKNIIGLSFDKKEEESFNELTA